MRWVVWAAANAAAPVAHDASVARASTHCSNSVFTLCVGHRTSDVGRNTATFSWRASPASSATLLSLAADARLQLARSAVRIGKALNMRVQDEGCASTLFAYYDAVAPAFDGVELGPSWLVPDTVAASGAARRHFLYTAVTDVLKGTAWRRCCCRVLAPCASGVCFLCCGVSSRVHRRRGFRSAARHQGGRIAWAHVPDACRGRHPAPAP